MATLIELGVPTRVYSVSLGGFDTHSDERGTQQRLLTELDRALTTFQTRLAATDRGRQVVTTIYSEFAGGLYGAEPSLTDLDDGDLKHHTDFRAVYAALLENWLGWPAGPVIGEMFKPVDVFA